VKHASLKLERVPVKVSTAAFCCLFLSSMAWSETVVVYAGLGYPQLSSSHVQIAVMLDGKPVKGARVDVYEWNRIRNSDGLLRFTGLTNDKGVATPPALVAGDYRVLGTLGDVSALLLLWVTDERTEMTTLSMMDLTALAHQDQEIQEAAVKRAEGLPIRDRVRAFRGVVVDASGALIPGAKIRILKNGSEGKTFVFGLNADSAGHFSAELSDGLYLGFFYSPGFRAEAIPFEVTKEGSGDLRLVLQVPETNLPIT
jgi:hypothetical protein